jgi:2-methylfumaryl-CoA isomerase
LNKGKRSIQIDLTKPEGQELATALITLAGVGNGIFLTNFPPRGWLGYERLKARRGDLVMVALTGNPDGSSEVDYTVNPATGFPSITGPRDLAEPVNSVLPAWDIAAGNLAAIAILAAERRRSRTGEGSLAHIALSDVAFAMTGNLGRLAQAEFGVDEPAKDGNYLYGAFGRDFATRDGRRVMIVALTERQWQALKSATGLAEAFAALAARTAIDLETQAGRFAARDAIAAVIEPWAAGRDLAEIERAFAGTGVSWGPYRTFRQLIAEDPRCSTGNPMFARVSHGGGDAYLTPGSPLHFSGSERVPPAPAPRPGEHTDQILADVLRLSSSEIGSLHDWAIVSGPK